MRNFFKLAASLLHELKPPASLSYNKTQHIILSTPVSAQAFQQLIVQLYPAGQPAQEI